MKGNKQDYERLLNVVVLFGVLPALWLIVNSSEMRTSAMIYLCFAGVIYMFYKNGGRS